jgi:mannosyl-3-phosphoglycerate phosphatase
LKQSVVFTDLDGTLLDHATYSWEPALPALRLLHDRQIPLVCCSSKTRTEIKYYRRPLDNRDPFVTENGGGIFIPEGYFDLSTLPPNLVRIGEPGYVVIRLGAQYQHLRQAVEELRAEGFALTGFGDMTVAEVAELTGLPLDQAAMAKERDFDEPFIFKGNSAEADKLSVQIRSKGFHSTKGAFFHILGNSDKGVAVEILVSLYRKKLGEIVIIALGDSLNDLPMLQRADYPVVVKKFDGSHDQNLNLPHLTKTHGIGPAGWNEAIISLLDGLLYPP